MRIMISNVSKGRNTIFRSTAAKPRAVQKKKCISTIGDFALLSLQKFRSSIVTKVSFVDGKMFTIL